MADWLQFDSAKINQSSDMNTPYRYEGIQTGLPGIANDAHVFTVTARRSPAKNQALHFEGEMPTVKTVMDTIAKKEKELLATPKCG